MLQTILVTAFMVSAVISGRVFDARTGVPLVGANVYLEGTQRGTSTDADGQYVISRVPIGTYTLVASMLGYKEQKVKIRVPSEDAVITQDFYLEESVVRIEKEVLVVAKKPEMNPEISGSIRSVSQEEIASLGTENISEVLATKAGVTTFENTEIHVRGGRSNEILLVLEGVPIRDPLSGSAWGIYVPATAVREAEALIGGYNAEYGQAMSGVINLQVREGSSKFQGQVEYFTDQMPMIRSFNSQRMGLSLSGPGPGKTTYFMTISGNFTDTYLPHADALYSSLLHRRFDHAMNTGSALLKITKKWPTTNLSLTLGRSFEVNQGYFYSRHEYPFAYGFPYRYIHHLEGYPTFTRSGEQAVLSLKKIIGSRAFLDLRIWRFFTGLRVNVDDKHWTEYEELLDLLPEPSDTHPYPGDGFYDFGDAPYWHDHYAETYGLRWDYTFKRSSVQEWKWGMETDYITAQWLDIQYPWYNRESGLGLNYDLYRVYTTEGAFYIQTQVYFAGMVANIGVRYDYWVPGKYVEDGVRRVLEDPTLHPFVRNQYEEFLAKGRKLPFLGLTFKGHFSPRFGVSYPVTDRDKFYFNYGHFSQIPDFKYIYSKLGRRATATYELVGNPNLDPTITVAYELGMEHRFSSDLRATIAAYYKDIFNYPTATRVPGIPPNPDFWMYLNSDYARSLGVEVTFKWNPPGPFYGSLEFSLSQSKGRASTSEDVYWSGRAQSLREWYLRWDQPYQVFLYLSYRTRDKGDHLGPIPMPPWFRLSLSSSFRSGRRYTPIDSLGIYGDPNSKLGPPWYRTDLRIAKGFPLGPGILWLEVSVRNLFDHRNVYYVNPLTGRAYEPGDPLPPGRRPIDYLNPARYRQPRTIYVGLRAEW